MRILNLAEVDVYREGIRKGRELERNRCIGIVEKYLYEEDANDPSALSDEEFSRNSAIKEIIKEIKGEVKE